MRTDQSPRLTLVRGGAGVDESGSAFTTYGPVRAGLITTHRTQSQALSELLNDLERRVEVLESRYSEVCATWNTDILPRVERLRSIIDEGITS